MIVINSWGASDTPTFEIICNAVRAIFSTSENFNGDQLAPVDKILGLNLAFKDSGADFIKFQSFKADNLVTKNAPKAKYQLRNMNNILDKKQAKMLKKLELTNNEMKLLCQYSKKKKIKFLLSPFDIDGVKLPCVETLLTLSKLL